MRRLLRQNSLGITVVVCFLMLWLGGQTTAGYRTYNQERVLDGQPSVSLDDDPSEHRSDPDAPWPVRRGGWWLAVYRNSLSLAFFALFAAAVLLHAWTGSRKYNHELETASVADRVTTWSYLTRSRFWFESLQSWQSEFLAVAAIVLLTIVLRQHGSPESKPVHAAHTTTG